MTVHRAKRLIVGSGPAGYTAAISAARAELKPMLVSGLQPGGRLAITTEVENDPGFAHAVQGSEPVEAILGRREPVTAGRARDDRRLRMSARDDGRSTGHPGAHPGSFDEAGRMGSAWGARGDEALCSGSRSKDDVG